MFSNLKVDPSSLLFSEERIDNRLLKKLKKSKHVKDKELLKLVNLADSKYFLDNNIVQLELIMLKKEKLIDLLCIALMVLFNYFMPTLEI